MLHVRICAGGRGVIPVPTATEERKALQPGINQRSQNRRVISASCRSIPATVARRALTPISSHQTGARH
jgi:hypothetical protein